MCHLCDGYKAKARSESQFSEGGGISPSVYDCHLSAGRVWAAVGASVKSSQYNPGAFLSEMVQFWTANYLRVANHQRGTQEFTGRLSAQEFICHASEA